MKIKVKLDSSGHWPVEYQGKEIEVEIQAITFPNGAYHGVIGLSGMELVIEENESAFPASRSLVDAIGMPPKKIEINF